MLEKRKGRCALQVVNSYTSVDQTEIILELRDILGYTCRGREGFRVSHFQHWVKADKTEKTEEEHGSRECEKRG